MSAFNPYGPGNAIIESEARARAGMNRVHVHPINDSIEHDLESDDCVCGPSVEFVPGGMVVTHHSLDGREDNKPREMT